MTRREAWQEQAACIGADSEAWFSDDSEITRAAKRVCAGCPVRTTCLTAALAEEDVYGYGVRYGIRGGLDPRERRIAAGTGTGTARPVPTHCRQGHDLPANYISGRGCPICAAETRELIGRAALALGMTWVEYGRAHGRARSTAEQIIAEHERTAA